MIRQTTTPVHGSRNRRAIAAILALWNCVKTSWMIDSVGNTLRGVPDSWRKSAKERHGGRSLQRCRRGRHTQVVLTQSLCLALPLIIGCGPSGPKLYPVSGAVTMDKKPIADGLISFRTIETGDLETMNIKDGQFRGNAKPGNRRVEIYTFRIQKGDFGGMPREFKQNLVPPRYSSESKLTANVTAEGPNQFTFDIESK
jgi:hypothetical protein